MSNTNNTKRLMSNKDIVIIIIAAIKDYQHILPSDVEEGYQKFNPRMIELKPRRQVGFNS